MTPLEIDILLHYYSRGGDYREGDFSAPAVREAIDNFSKREEMLRPCESGSRTYALSERGMAYVDALMRLPLPRRVWLMPSLEHSA
jgi:hypothetical protein